MLSRYSSLSPIGRIAVRAGYTAYGKKGEWAMLTGVLRNPAARRFRQFFPRSLSIDGLLGKPLLDYTHRRTTRWGDRPIVQGDPSVCVRSQIGTRDPLPTEWVRGAFVGVKLDSRRVAGKS